MDDTKWLTNWEKIIVNLGNDYFSGTDEEEGRRRAQVKNVVELRQRLVHEFISGRCFQKIMCPHCITPLRALRTEHNNKIFFSIVAKKTIAKLREKMAQKSVSAKKIVRFVNFPENIMWIVSLLHAVVLYPFAFFLTG